jgi:ribosome-associated protein
LIAESLDRPKVRIKTKPSRGAREERIKAKTVRGKVKKMRSGKFEFD